MPITFLCPQCNRRLATATRKAGHALVCPACNGQVIVPLVRRPVCTGGDGTRLGLGRLALVSALVAWFAAQALAISAGFGGPGVEQPRADLAADTATVSLPTVPTVTAHPILKAESEQPRTILPAQPNRTVEDSAIAPQAAVEPPEPIVVFVPIVREEPAPVTAQPITRRTGMRCGTGLNYERTRQSITPSPPSGDCGTGLEFERTPLLAAEKARKERKLLMLLHISGNFEDSKFT